MRKQTIAQQIAPFAVEKRKYGWYLVRPNGSAEKCSTKGAAVDLARERLRQSSWNHSARLALWQLQAS